MPASQLRVLLLSGATAGAMLCALLLAATGQERAGPAATAAAAGQSTEMLKIFRVQVTSAADPQAGLDSRLACQRPRARGRLDS
jgi:hypothetical protein